MTDKTEKAVTQEQQRTLTAKVISNKMDKSVSVSWFMMKTMHAMKVML